MNSREPGHLPQQLGSGRAARLRRRRRKRLALFASFIVIILLIVLAIVLLALEIADVSQKLKGSDDTSPPGETDTNPLSDYAPATGTYSIHEGTLILVNKSKNEYVFPAVGYAPCRCARAVRRIPRVILLSVRLQQTP